jgi:phosphotriesterase-related protein
MTRREAVRLLGSGTVVAFPSMTQPAAAATIASVVDGQITTLEKQMLELAEAMPESRFNFSPEHLPIPGSDYKGVRTFALQIRHVAASNYFLWSSVTGDGFPKDFMGGDGPERLKGKSEIVKFLKDSFTLGHKAAANLTGENALYPATGTKSTRLEFAVFAVAHAFDHYGQMVEYARMNGIVPPASLGTAPIVRTVLSDVSPSQITGMTLIHEHLSMNAAGSNQVFSFYRDLDLMTQEVQACAEAGVSCIVDTGHPDLGRSIDALRTIAHRSGMLIVAGGGFHSKAVYPADIAGKTEEQIADDMYKLASIERWGVIGEIGTGTAVPMDRDERKVLRAVAQLHRRTGLSIITHVSDGCARCALDQIDVYEQAGVNLNRVVVGHLNDITEQPTAAPLAIAKRGAYVGFDNSGRPDDPRQAEYVRTIMALLDAGYADRVCLSSDFSNGQYLRRNGGPGIAMTITEFVPRLRQAGVSDAALHQILVENPLRALAFVPRT